MYIEEESVMKTRCDVSVYSEAVCEYHLPGPYGLVSEDFMDPSVWLTSL